MTDISVIRMHENERPHVQGLSEPLIFCAKPVPIKGFPGIGKSHGRGFLLFLGTFGRNEDFGRHLHC